MNKSNMSKTENCVLIDRLRLRLVLYCFWRSGLIWFRVWNNLCKRFNFFHRRQRRNVSLHTVCS